MLVIVLFLLQWTTGVLSQGIFSPPEFTAASCSGGNQWTTWFDSGDPSLTLGEFEVTTHIQQIFSSFMCPIPIAIEVSIFYVDLFLLFNKDNIYILGSYTGRRKSGTNW